MTVRTPPAVGGPSGILGKNPYADRRSFVARAMALEPIGDISVASLSESTSTETVTWETATDWDNAVEGEFVLHNSDTINMTVGTDSYEDLSFGTTSFPSPYRSGGSPEVVDPANTDVSSAWDGDKVVETTTYGFGVEGLGGVTPTKIWHYWWEDGSNRDTAFAPTNSSGNPIAVIGTNNPQINFRTGDRSSQVDGGDQGEWQYSEWTFDWDNSTVDLYWESQSTGSTANWTGDNFINSASGIYEFYNSGSFGGWASGNTDQLFTDEYWGVFNSSFLTTATKSFSESKQPDLQSLSYSLDGETITLDIIGSPGSGSEETVTQVLDGSTGYSLSWTNSHTDFRVKVDLSTTDRSGASVPTFGKAELVA